MMLGVSRPRDGSSSRFAVFRARIEKFAPILRLLRRVHRTLYGARTTIAFIAVVLVTFLGAPQAEELGLACAESPLALSRMLVAVVWFAAIVWHCSDAKFRSKRMLLAGRLAAFRRSAVPVLLAVGFVGAMAVAEFRMMQIAAALPRDPVRLYPILEMQSLGILILPAALRLAEASARHRLWHACLALVRILRSRFLFGGAGLALFVWAFSTPVNFAWTLGT